MTVSSLSIAEKRALAEWLDKVITVAEDKLADGQTKITFNLSRELIERFARLKSEVSPPADDPFTRFAKEIGDRDLRLALASLAGWHRGCGRPLSEQDMREIIELLKASGGTPEEWVYEIEKWMGNT